MAKVAYRLFQNDPSHPGLRFGKVHTRRPIYSARIDLDYRTIGTLEGGEITWFWIGNHREYDRMLKSLRG